MPFYESVKKWAQTNRAALSFDAPELGELGYARLAETAEGFRSSFFERCEDLSRFCRPMAAVFARSTPEFVRLIVALDAAGFITAILDPAWPKSVLEATVRRLEPLAVIEDHEIGDALALRRRLSKVLDRDRSCLRVDSVRGEAFLVLFTSGSTGFPKALGRSRASWLWALRSSVRLFDARSDSLTLSPASMAYSLTLYALAESLFSGGVFHLLARPCLGLMARVPATRLVATASFYRALLDYLGDCSSVLLGSLIAAVSAGEALDSRTEEGLASLFPGLRLHEYFGASELGFISYSSRTLSVQAPLAKERGPGRCVGKRFPGLKIRIRRGIVWTRSPQHAMRLVGSGRANLRFLPPPRWSSVYDRGYIEAGLLYWLGRDMVTVGGENVFLEVSERALRTLVDPGAVLAVYDRRLGNRLVGVLKRKLTEAEHDWLAERLLPSHKPSAYVVVKDWPANLRRQDG